MVAFDIETAVRDRYAEGAKAAQPALDRKSVV